VFVLTHHPEDAQAAGGKDLEVFSPTIGRQLVERGLIDEIDLHIAPVLLGDGIRLFDNP
jgi:dihydrofolate reductase